MELLFELQAKKKDVVFTPEHIAQDMVQFFNPTGKILDPCKGDGVFLKFLPPKTDWCEIREGKDFYHYTQKVDWIISNPPYSDYSNWLSHSMKIAKNIVYLIPINKAFNSYKMLVDMNNWGGIKHIRVYASGSNLKFPVGFAVGAVHFKKNYAGGIETTFWQDKLNLAI